VFLFIRLEHQNYVASVSRLKCQRFIAVVSTPSGIIAGKALTGQQLSDDFQRKGLPSLRKKQNIKRLRESPACTPKLSNQGLINLDLFLLI